MLFRRKVKQPPQSSAIVPASSQMPKSYLAENLTVSGTIVSKGSLVIAGRVEGDVFCPHTKVLEVGSVQGSVVASEIRIDGRIVGDVSAAKIQLAATGAVIGDVCYTVLRK